MAKHNPTEITVEPGKLDIIITREFEAPLALVYRAHVDPALYAQWLGPRGYKMTLETFEPHTGGSYRYLHEDSHGNVYAFRGIYHLVLPLEMIVQTFEFEGLPEQGHVSLETAHFEALPGDRTRIVAQSVFQSVEDRDGIIASGMERGVNEGHQRLDELLKSLQS